MPLFKTISFAGGLIGVWKLVEKSSDLLLCFSPEELADPSFQQYTHEKRKVEWLATRVLIKQLIGSEFAISYLESGKPILNHTRFKHLSISHSRWFVAVILHEHLNVGIDIEDMTRNYNPVEKKYLSEDELVQVAKKPLLQCLYWCAKEAIFKLVPEDGVEFRQQIHIFAFNPELEDHFSARFTTESKESIYQLHFQSFADHCWVWVAV
jgi:phosphopantetheinyl transferase